MGIYFLVFSLYYRSDSSPTGFQYEASGGGADPPSPTSTSIRRLLRIRQIHPAFWNSPDIVCLPIEARLLFIGLWNIADREGRLEDNHERIGMQIFPKENFDIDALLSRMEARKIILRYEVEGTKYINITAFAKHQHCHIKEQASRIPAPRKPGASPVHAPDKPGGSPPSYDIRLTASHHADARAPDGAVVVSSPVLDVQQEKKKQVRSVVVSRFAEFWDLRWRSDGKKMAEKSFAKFAISDRMSDLIIEAEKRDKPGMESRLDKTKRPHMSTWLNQQRFLDDEPAPAELNGHRANATERAAMSIIRDQQEAIWLKNQ